MAQLAGAAAATLLLGGSCRPFHELLNASSCLAARRPHHDANGAVRVRSQRGPVPDGRRMVQPLVLTDQGASDLRRHRRGSRRPSRSRRCDKGSGDRSGQRANIETDDRVSGSSSDAHHHGMRRSLSDCARSRARRLAARGSQEQTSRSSPGDSRRDSTARRDSPRARRVALIRSGRDHQVTPSPGPIPGAKAPDANEDRVDDRYQIASSCEDLERANRRALLTRVGAKIEEFQKRSQPEHSPSTASRCRRSRITS